MKTLDEVIKTLENGCTRCGECPYCDDKYCRNELDNDALHYLKEYQKILPLVPSLINTAIAVQKKGKTIG